MDLSKYLKILCLFVLAIPVNNYACQPSSLSQEKNILHLPLEHADALEVARLFIPFAKVSVTLAWKPNTLVLYGPQDAINNVADFIKRTIDTKPIAAALSSQPLRSEPLLEIAAAHNIPFLHYKQLPIIDLEPAPGNKSWQAGIIPNRWHGLVDVDHGEDYTPTAYTFKGDRFGGEYLPLTAPQRHIYHPFPVAHPQMVAINSTNPAQEIPISEDGDILWPTPAMWAEIEARQLSEKDYLSSEETPSKIVFKPRIEPTVITEPVERKKLSDDVELLVKNLAMIEQFLSEVKASKSKSVVKYL